MRHFYFFALLCLVLAGCNPTETKPQQLEGTNNTNDTASMDSTSRDEATDVPASENAVSSSEDVPAQQPSQERSDDEISLNPATGNNNQTNAVANEAEQSAEPTEQEKQPEDVVSADDNALPDRADAGAAESVASTKPRSPWTTSKVQGLPDPPLPYEVEEVFDGLCFYAPVTIQQIPGTKQYLIGELCGRIYSIDDDDPVADPALVIDLFANSSVRPPAPARGQAPVTTDNPLPATNLYDFVFHPEFSTNRQIFVTYKNPEENVAWLSRFDVTTDNPPVIQAESEVKYLSYSASGHNGGCVRFGPDGYLYLSTGDGVGPNPPDVNDVGQDISNLLSSVLRIDVDTPEGDLPYSIPPDNPFVNTETARPEVWAYGFRNPWRMDFDRSNGKLWVGDVGWETWEMVYYVSSGGNYGWPIMEGRKRLRTEVTSGPTPIQPPVKDYNRSEANSITGGIVYSGKKYPDLEGWFVHGDYRTGHIWAIKMDDSGVPQHRHLATSSICIIAFMETTEGEILVMDHDRTGRTFRLVPSSSLDESVSFPQDLASTGLFADVPSLQPAEGVIPYDVVVEPWMDGAHATRWLALPGESQIAVQVSSNGSSWSFPEGTVFAQTILYPVPGMDPVRLETRLLHREDGSWRGYSYRWNEEQSNAVLVSSSGETFPLPHQGSGADSPVHESWNIVSRTECMFCHRERSGSIHGFTPYQLDRTTAVSGLEVPQLDWLISQEVFAGNPREGMKTESQLVDPHDPGHVLNDRARSYLDMNCGICHNPRGESITMFYLRRHYSLDAAKALNEPSIGKFNMEDPRLIAPGDPYRSIVLYRLGKLGNARMPYMGSRVVDPNGFALMHDWIESLDGEMTSLSDSELASVAVLNSSDADSAAEDDKAIAQLLETTSGALALLAVIHVDGVSAELQQRIINQSRQSPVPTVRSLFEDMIPESERRPTLGDNISPEVILDLTGDAARGQLIYQSDSSRCRSCHAPDENGQSLGADLREIGKKYRKPDLLLHILEPSRKMEPSHVPHLILTNDGKSYTGLIVERDEETLVVRNARLETLKFDQTEVEEVQPLDRSIMPERLLSDMTAQEAADLLEYLSTLQGDQ
ncbi:MAG: PQQ-dependent sugar dehydrogenase [Pirellulaceae bacterium]|nr:PQQ-dependent sugar dehydrogenase [Pirellulaceae bacterium]